MNDITIIFLTVNRVPKKWATFHRSVLEKAIGSSPIISISKQPLDLGINLIQTENESSSNIYFQLLRGAKLAKTPYIALAEDDTLYPPEHFKFRPPMNTVAYDLSRFIVNIVRPEICYYYRPRSVNTSLIASRDLVVKTLEERYSKYPNGTPDKYSGEIGRWEIENGLQIKRVRKMEFKSEVPLVQFKHDYRRPELGSVLTTSITTPIIYDLPPWGKAVELVKYFS